MRSLFAPLALVVAGAAAGCVDTKTCHNAVDWKPCAGQVAEPGASGSPPEIVQLSAATCAYLTAPSVAATLHVTDVDGDAQVIKATITTGGMRADESELELDDAERNGNDWSGGFTIAVTGSAGGMPMQSSSDVSIKVTDRAGAQSIPFCNSIALVP